MTAAPEETSGLPKREMTLVGGVVLLISIGAFFRVPLLPSIGDELAMTAGQLGLITTLFGVGRLCTDIPAGRLADRVPPLRSLGVAGGFLLVGSLAVAAAQVDVVVIAAAFVLGVASSLANTTGMTFFSTAAPPARRGSSMAVFSAALLGGQALGPMAGGAIGGAAGWRVALVAAAVVGGVVALSGVASGSLRSPPQPSSTAGHHGAAEAAVASVPRLQRWVLYSVSFALMFMLGSMPQTLIPIIGDDRYALSPGRIGLALGVGGACRFVGALVGGRLADRVSRKGSLVPGMALCSAGVALLAFELGVAGWVGAIVLLSLGSYGVTVSATMLADHARGSGVGRRLGAYRFVGDIGLILGPSLSGVLYEHVSDRAAVLAVAGLVGAVTVLCAAVLHETRWLHETDTTAGE